MNFFERIFRSTNSNMPQPGGTISALFDYRYPSDRWIAADDLGGYDEPVVQSVLLFIACNPNEDEDLLDICGESLGLIWWRNDIYDEKILSQLTVTARKAFDLEYGSYSQPYQLPPT